LGGNQPAITQSTFGRQQIYFQHRPDFCLFEDFLLCAHELVHVLQIQQLSGGPSSWNFNYVVCWISAGFSSTVGNCFEDEAYEFANAQGHGRDGYPQPGLLRQMLPQLPPYKCNNPGTFGLYAADNNVLQQIINLSKTNPSIVKRTTKCSVADCFSHLGFFGSIFAFLAATAALIFTLAGSGIANIVGAVVVGVPVAIIVGVAVALAIASAVTAGLALGIVVGVIVGAVAGVIGAAIGALIGALIAALVDLIGDSGGKINLVFGTDANLANPGFDCKVEFEQTREQIALAFAPNVLWVGWSGTDNAVNVMSVRVGSNGDASSATKRTFEQSNNCGPALAFDPASNVLVVCWQGFDGRLNLRVSTDMGDSFPDPTKVTFDPRGPADATPGLAFLNGVLYIAWIGPGNILNLWATRDLGHSFVFQKDLGIQTFGTGTAALAVASDGRLFLAFMDQNGARLSLLVFLQGPTGDVTLQSSTAIGFAGVVEIGDDQTGPAVAFDENTGNVIVSWVANNNSDLILGFSTDGVTFSNRTVLLQPANPNPEQSRGNTGPALLYVGNEIVWGWTGRG
jgi:hypothetical protein